MGSLLITPFSCTNQTQHSKMKVFATLATILGASTASPLLQNQMRGSNDIRLNHHSMHGVMKPSVGMSMESQMSQHNDLDRRMDMYRDNQHNPNRMGQEMVDRNMMGEEMSSNMKDVHRQNQAIGFTAPNQFFVKDNFGNYVYSYNDQQSEKSEEGNKESIKGQYAYIMSNGVKRRVEYIAGDNGFHVIRDNADPARIKRSTDPDLLQTRMTSVMDSSSLRDDARDLYKMTNVMGRYMPYKMETNFLGMDHQQRESNMMGPDSLNRNMMGQDTMMGRNIYNLMSNRGMNSDVSDMMGRQMNANMVGRDMSMNMMSLNMMDRDRNSKMNGRKMLGHQEITPNTKYSNNMGQDMMEVSNNRMSSMNSRGRSSGMMDTLSNNGLMGQRMMQRIEIESVPETYASSRLF